MNNKSGHVLYKYSHCKKEDITVMINKSIKHLSIDDQVTVYKLIYELSHKNEQKPKGRKSKVEVGMRFGELIVLRKLKSKPRPNGGGTRTVFEVKCDCGKTKEVLSGNLVSGSTKSCGHRRERPSLYDTKTYKCWDNMIQRCTNENRDNYENYGGRGIKVCESWRVNFRNFLNDMGDKPIGLTLDRIDNDGNYEKDNCRWATYSTQNKNRRKQQRNK